MRFRRRVIPVSSGKGGVGKTTFAVNYALALARHGRTLLVDLDTGTSSVRSCIDTPVSKDLYHFFKKGQRLSDCVTTLDARLDPKGLYKNFGFIAGPKHMIGDITNLNRDGRTKIIEAINELDATFVVLDLKAGLDTNVVSFLPFSNSGILVFTPHLSAATLAASDVVKAILFRKLRGLFAEGSRLYDGLQGVTPTFVHGLLDRVEDVYDDSVQNLDAFVEDLRHALGDHPVVALVAEAVGSFVVHYVLNMFNGVEESYETAVKPFVKNLEDNVSARMDIFNLGWIIAHDEIHQANLQGVPALLYSNPGGSRSAADPAHLELERLAARYRRPGSTGRTARPAVVPRKGAPEASEYLGVQLDTLKSMYANLGTAGYHDNFRYIAHRSLHLLSSRRIADFGGRRVYKEEELMEVLRVPSS